MRVKSSVFSSIEYNEEREELTLTMRNGKRYVYFPVPKRIWVRLKMAKSKGVFYNDMIKGQYNSSEV